MDELYYMQDTRHVIGNDMVLWRKNKCGYTTDLNDAEVWTKEKAFNQHKIRETDLPWPKKYIDSKSHPTVDFQYCNHKEAMESKQ